VVKAGIPFQYEDDVVYGQIEEISPRIRRIMAPNPSPFTYRVTGTYIVDRGHVTVIDPGPNLESHVSAIADALRDEVVTHIVITHAHGDHSAAAKPLQNQCGAPVYGRTLENYSDDAEQFEEEFDRRFVASIEVSDGAVIAGDGWHLECVHTPGHMSNHFCYRLREENALFSGDHVMGWSTSVIIPPDGNMRDYLASLHKLLECDDQIYYPTHGPPIRSPKSYVNACIAHRQTREQAVVQSLRRGHSTIQAMVADVYYETPPNLHAAAAQSLLATLIKLKQDGQVDCDSEPSLSAHFTWRA